MPAPPPADKTLVVASLAGDRRAQGELVDRLTPAIHRGALFALRRAWTPPSSSVAQAALDDVVQDVWRLLFERGGDVLRRWDPAGGASLETWVSRVSGRHALTWLRNQRTRRRHVASGADDRVEERRPDTRDAARDLEQRDLLREVLRRLGAEIGPQGLRVLERLVEHGGGSRDAGAIAAELEMSVAAVRKWRQRLRRRIADIHASILAEVSDHETDAAGENR